MKLINNTSCNISAYIFNGILHLTISHKDKSWLGGTSYRGGGCLHDDGVHFEMYDDYDPTGEKLVDEDDHEKYKEFCLIPETDESPMPFGGCEVGQKHALPRAYIAKTSLQCLSAGVRLVSST